MLASKTLARFTLKKQKTKTCTVAPNDRDLETDPTAPTKRASSNGRRRFVRLGRVYLGRSTKLGHGGRQGSSEQHRPSRPRGPAPCSGTGAASRQGQRLASSLICVVAYPRISLSTECNFEQYIHVFRPSCEPP